MKKLFGLATAAALLASVSVAAAQEMNREGMWADQDDSGAWMVYGPDNTEGMAVTMGTAGTRPADCPAGTFYEGAQDQIMACDDDSTFMMVAPEAGSMMPSGEPWSETARMLEYREN
jgi:hypothetical protein